MSTFQDLILTLQQFWADHGCLIWQPHNQVVGAGTMNPATFLRVLGPEPWKVAYVEPSVRPDDGRFGQNPNRLYTHTQFQVILKPSPERSQELYLESLRAIGIDLSAHDIRFVEDNWTQPTIGAWGLGWEVWLDGLEITQYTYFQQVGGVTLNPTCLEITYGLERIAMALQGVQRVFDLRWDSQRSYGDVRLSDEQERSAYAFQWADVPTLQTLFECYERECLRALEHKLVLPAHDYVLQCSHTFNLLDTRGAIGVTERQRFIARMRDLARQVALTYIAQREEIGFPWLTASSSAQHDQPASLETAPDDVALEEPETLLVELGVEELPAGDVPICEAQLRDRLVSALEAARIPHGDLITFATPRRVAVLISDVAPRQQDLDVWVKGPPARTAFDSEGNPTQAAVGFARRLGVAVEQLIVKEEGSGAYVYARQTQRGQTAFELLQKLIPSTLSQITFEKTMRWNASNVAFARPINWIVALLGKAVVPFQFAGVRSGRSSWGSRGEGSPRFEIRHARDYPELLKAHRIIGDARARKAEILRQAQALADQVNAKLSLDEDLLEEVTHLVEQPTAILCGFPEEYLSLPAPVLTSVMRKKQRYMTLLRPDNPDELMPYFITIRNGPQAHNDLVRKGNEDVVNARFADAAYFYREDIKKPLEAYLPRLDTIVFQAKLGSIGDKARRITKLVERLADMMQVTDESTRRIACKAARLCKADLATQMVIEITALHGVMGREYHLKTSQDADREAVAEAIFEHLLPRFSGDALPQTTPGFLVGLADRLDSLAGLFAAGVAPKGNADPFALRRTAIGLIQCLLARKQEFSVLEGLRIAAELLPIPAEAEMLHAAHTFVLDRERQIFLERGFRHDVVEAILSVIGDNPSRAEHNLVQLDRVMQRADWTMILAAYARCARIARGHHVTATDIADDAPASQALHAAIRAQPKPHDVDSLVKVLHQLIPFINTFFNSVMVMVEDERVRHSRLALVMQVVELADGIADLSKLEGF